MPANIEVIVAPTAGQRAADAIRRVVGALHRAAAALRRRGIAIDEEIALRKQARQMAGGDVVTARVD